MGKTLRPAFYNFHNNLPEKRPPYLTTLGIYSPLVAVNEPSDMRNTLMEFSVGFAGLMAMNTCLGSFPSERTTAKFRGFSGQIQEALLFHPKPKLIQAIALLNNFSRFQLRSLASSVFLARRLCNL